jgi:hypothetical protein
MIAFGLGLDLYSVLIFIRMRTTVNPLRPGSATQLVVSGVYEPASIARMVSSGARTSARTEFPVTMAS